MGYHSQMCKITKKKNVKLPVGWIEQILYDQDGYNMVYCSIDTADKKIIIDWNEPEE